MINNIIPFILLFIVAVSFMFTTNHSISEIESEIQNLSGSIAASQSKINRASEENESRWFKTNSTLGEIQEENKNQQRYIDGLVEELDISNSTSEIIETKECGTGDMVPVLLRYTMGSSNQPLPKGYRLYQGASTIGTVKVMGKGGMIGKVICYSRSEIVTDDE